MLSAKVISFFTWRQGEINTVYFGQPGQSWSKYLYVCGVVTPRDTSLTHGEDGGMRWEGTMLPRISSQECRA